MFGELKRGFVWYFSEYLLWFVYELIMRYWVFFFDDGDESEDLIEFVLYKILEICIEVIVI